MKIGIVGFGSIGSRHYENIKKHTEDIAIFSNRTDCPEVPLIKNWKTFVAQGPYDALFITNETSKHAQTIKECIKLKPRALFIEKPLSHTSAGLRTLQKVLEKNKISSWVGYNFQFFAPFVRIKELLAKKEIGQVYYIRAAVGQDLSEWRKRDYRTTYSAKTKGGGGVMLDLVHDLNYPSWLLGEVLEAKACVVKKISPLKIETEDFAESVLATKKGVMVSVHQDYVRRPGRRSLEIAGEKGSILWDSENSDLTITRGQKTTVQAVAVERNDMYRDEVAFFLAALERKKYFSNFAEGFRDIVLIEQLKKYAKR